MVVLLTAVLVHADVTTEYSVVTTDSTAESETTDTVSVGEQPVDYTGAQIVRVTAMQTKDVQMLNTMVQSGGEYLLIVSHSKK